MRKIIRVIREGLTGVKRHSAMSFSSASAVTMTLLIIGAFLLVNTNIQKIATGIESTVEIHAKIEQSVEETSIGAIQRKIEAIEGVKAVTYSSKDQELEYFMESYGEQGELFEMYVGENNPMRNAFLVETINGEYIEQVAEQISHLDGIEGVNYGGVGTLTLINSLESFRNTGSIVVIALGFLALLLIVNTINTTIESRENEIFIMRTVGASNGFIRWPFIIEGITIGFLGSIIPILVCGLGYLIIYRKLNGVLFTEMFSLTDPSEFLGTLVLTLLAMGIGVGGLGSFIAVSKKLWWKR